MIVKVLGKTQDISISVGKNINFFLVLVTFQKHAKKQAFRVKVETKLFKRFIYNVKILVVDFMLINVV